MKRALLAVGLLAGSPCSPNEPPEASSVVAPVEPLDALSRRLGRARQRLRDRGYLENGWGLRIFLPAESARAEPVQLKRGVCTTFLALSGGAIRQLELSLFDADGRRAAVDSVPGEGSLVHACLPAATKPAGSATAVYFLKARSAGGAGAVSIRAFESPVGSSLGVDGIFEDLLAPPEPSEAIDVHLERAVDRLRSRGMTPIGRTVVARVLEGEALRRANPLESGRCYVAVARGDQTVRDISLYLFDPTGTEVARNLEGHEEARVEHCAEQDGNYVVEARAAGGSGGIGIAMALDPSAAPAPSSTLADPANEQERLDAVRNAVDSMMQRGYLAPRYVVRGSLLRTGERVLHDVALAPGCSVILAAPETGEIDLDLYLADSDGDSIASDTRITSEARLATCRDQAETVHVTVKAYGREGSYALVTLEAPAGASDVRHVRLLEVTGPMIGRGYERSALEEMDLTEGVVRRLPIEATAGSCVFAVIAGAQSIEDVDLSLVDETGRILASDTGPHAWASVGRCVDEDRSFELEVVAYQGAGDALLQTMRKPR